MINKDKSSVDTQIEVAIKFQKNSEFERARSIYEKLLNIYINNSQVLFLIGTLEAQTGNFEKSISYLQKASIKNPNSWEINFNLGNVYVEVNKFKNAIKYYNKAISIYPDNPILFYYRGLVRTRLEEYSLSQKDFKHSLSLDSKHTPSILQLGIAQVKLLEYEKALENFKLLTKIEPKNSEFYFQYGLTLFLNKNYLCAISVLKLAIKWKPKFPEAHLVIGDAMHALKNNLEAVKYYNKSISLDNKNELAYYSRSIVLMESKLYSESLSSLKTLMDLNPEYDQGYNAMSIIYLNLGKLDLALDNVTKAIQLNSNEPNYYMNQGNILSGLRRFNDSLSSYNKAIEIKPNNSEAYCNSGFVLLNYLGQNEAALHLFNMAINLQPDLTVAFVNRAECFVRLHQFDRALKDFLTALEMDGESNYILGKCLHYKMKISDWDNLNEGFVICEAMLVNGSLGAVPFETLNFFDKPNVHLISAKLFNNNKAPSNNSLCKLERQTCKSVVKIGYFSADLYYHPVSIWLAEQLENHDKTKVELYAFCMKSVRDPMRDRLETAFDHWIDVTNLSDLEVTKLSRELGIDIAIDLNGHTADGRPGIFAARAAPIQLSHLGFPGTSGADYIDYIIGHTPSPDEDLEELTRNRQFITEKIAYVPSSFTYDRQRQLSKEPLTRAQFGLPEAGFVFTCQNGCQKLLPEVFDIWMEILKAVPGSVLWLLKPNETAVKNLIKEANSREVGAERLIFTAREVVPFDQEKARTGRYLASYRLADLFLDTWPYNAGTTAVDALWAGLPVLTKKGKALVARMATEALRGIEVPELITKTPEEYKELAIELAHNPDKLKQLKEKIQRNRLTTALFDPVANTRHIENAYLEMYRRYAAGEQPNDFIVQP